MKIIQQGDLIFIPIKEIPKTAKKIKSEGEYHILAKGEATGHSHRISVQEANVYTDEQRMFIGIISGMGVVIHEEHKGRTLTHPFYEVKRVREYDYDEKQARTIKD